MRVPRNTVTNLRLCAVCGEALGPNTSIGIRSNEAGQREYFHKVVCSPVRQPFPPLPPVEPPAKPLPPAPGDPRQAASMLDGLDEEQLRAVHAPLGPVRILAGAGTGKTRSITHRIAYYHHLGEAPAHQVLAVTHSRRAAAEMRERLEVLGAGATTASTFHAAAGRQLRMHWSLTGLPGEHLTQLLGPERFALVRSVLGQVTNRPGPKVASDLVRDLADELSWAAVRCLTPATYPAAAEAATSPRSIDLDRRVIADCLRLFKETKTRRAVLDFDDLLEACATLIEQKPQAAEAIRDRFQHFVVDEYQDTDPAQQRLLQAWLGQRKSICVVGDPHQAIYAFKGADPSLLARFTDTHRRAVSVSLIRDYRSTPQIVAVANRIVRAKSGSALIGQQSAGPEPTLLVYPDEDSEALGLVTTIKGLLSKGVAAGQIAVLHRFRAQALPLRTALLAAGIPTATGEEDRFFARAEIRRALAAFTVAGKNEPEAAPLALMSQVLTEQGFAPQRPPAELGEPYERHQAQVVLLSLVETLPLEHRSSVAATDQELGRRVEQERVPASTVGVSVLTLHTAKGLEWDAVILPRMTQGSLPASMARTAEQQEEERRLFYVGVTRARQFLHLSHARTRNGSSSRPSPYLQLLHASPPPTSTTPGKAKPTQDVPPKAPSKVRSHSRWPVGRRISHDQFGVGTVCDSTNNWVTVEFGAPHGTKCITAATRKMTLL